MISNRKWAFMLGALLVAGIGLDGCEEDNFNCDGCYSSLIDGSGTGGGNSSDYKLMSDYTNSALKKANDACKKNGCASNSACKTGADYVACLCSTTYETEKGTQYSEACQTYDVCKGVGNCKVECGSSVDSCSWPVCKDDDSCKPEGAVAKVKAFGKASYTECKKSEDCAAAAAICKGIAALNPGYDFDGDTLTNNKELENDYSHPCFKDTDGDGLTDDKDDEPYSGGDLSNEEAILRGKFCSLISGDAGQFLEMTIARLDKAVYTPESDVTAGKVTTFTDSSNKIVGFFGSGQSKNGGQLLKAAGLLDGTYVEESNFTSSVPLADWIKKGYKAEFQVVPNSDVLRLKYSIDLGDQTLEDVAVKIAKVFDSSKAKKPASTTKCASNKAVLYLARSTYSDDKGKLRIYGGAMTCSENKNNVKTMNILDDVLSGTLVAPTNKGFSSAETNGYLPYLDSYCQASQVGKASGAVDFVWVVDNSGSMEDELDNVASTITIFANRLKGSGIDYRVAVTTTDAYAIDESNAWAVAGDKVNLYEAVRTDASTGAFVPAANKYYNALGIRNGTGNYSSNAYYPGFISVSSAITPAANGGKSYFTMCINLDSRCTPTQKNVCGIGYEDGFRSGTFVLSRLAVDTTDDPAAIEKSKAMLNPADVANYDKIVAMKKSIAKGEFKNWSSTKNTFEPITVTGLSEKKVQDDLNDMMLRDEALKYIIWVSDEETRQFKEEQKLYSSSSFCLNGNKLSGGNMSYGNPSSTSASDACNAYIGSALNTAITNNIAASEKDQNQLLLQDMSLDELKKVSGLGDYTAMLEYYLTEYRRFAGSGGIAGFALVGDIGNRNGGSCKNLQVCTGTCYASAEDKTGHDAKKEAGCFDCSAGGWSEDQGAVEGANYGLSYIHLARFLSLSSKDGKDEGKEGGFASVCSKNFETTINSIFEDVSGRVSSHTLERYPISNTIRVAYLGIGKTVPTELTRGAEKKGFTYDASQNAVVFVGITDLATKDHSTEDWFAISYDIWSKGQG